MPQEIAVITGAGRGLGKAIASKLATLEKKIVIVDKEAITAEETAQDLTKKGYSVSWFNVDLVNYHNTKKMFEKIIEDCGHIDALVNVAGKGMRRDFWEVSEEQWDDTLNINLKTVFNTCSSVVKHMMSNKKGVIINTASVAGIRGGGLLSKTPYAAAKSGVIGFTKSLARELAPYNIRVNCIAPGFHTTPATINISENDRERCLSQVALKRAGDANDLAEVVAFLLSNGANFITGVTIPVDGGFSML